MAASPTWYRAEHELDEGARVRSIGIEVSDPRGHPAGKLGHHTSGKRDEIDGEFRAGSVAARSRQCDHHHVGRRRDRAGFESDRADVELGLAVQTDDRGNAIQSVVGDDVECSSGYTFLCRLEDEPDRAGQLVAMMSEVERRTERDGGVHVVAAHVRDARHLAAVGDVLLVGHREGVEVGTYGESAVERTVGAGWRPRWHDVTDQSGAHGEPARAEAGELESFVHHVGGRQFLTAQFGVSVQIAPQGDEAVGVFVEPLIDGVPSDAAEPGRRLGHRGASAPVIASAASSYARWWTTSASVPPAPTTSR